MSGSNLKESIRLQREKLTSMLSEEMHQLAVKCMLMLDDRDEMERLLSEVFPHLAFCKHLYILDAEGKQITDNITQTEKDTEHFGRNRMDRPYMQGIIGTTDFKLSDAYISQLALYQLLVRRIYPDHEAKTALLWSETPKLMFVPQAMLDKQLKIIATK